MSLYRLDHPKTDEDVASIRAALAKLAKANPMKKAAEGKTLAPHKPPAPRAEDGGSTKPATKKAAPKPAAKKTSPAQPKPQELKS
jgi:hypothetical protein